MFKPLNNYFAKKIKNIKKNSGVNIEISKIVNEFLIESFQNQEFISFIKSEYNTQNNTVTIVAPNKIIANELVLRVNKLYKLLSKKNLDNMKVLIK